MIIDSHSHAWPRWPYEPPVPDSDSRGRIEQLLHEMDRNGVDQAVLVCARIDHNPDNNDYIFECAKQYPGRIIQFADVDCSWTDTYHTPGAADRLAEAADKYALKGYTHYFRGDDDGSWFFTDEGDSDSFQTTADRGLIASLAMGPQLQAPLRKLAAQFPSITFLCHHMAGARAGEEPPYPNLKEILVSASTPNINIKMSGFGVCLPISMRISLFRYRLDCTRTLRTFRARSPLLGIGLPCGAFLHDLPTLPRSVPHALHTSSQMPTRQRSSVTPSTDY